ERCPLELAHLRHGGAGLDAALPRLHEVREGDVLQGDLAEAHAASRVQARDGALLPRLRRRRRGREAVRRLGRAGIEAAWLGAVSPSRAPVPDADMNLVRNQEALHPCPLL